MDVNIPDQDLDSIVAGFGMPYPKPVQSQGSGAEGGDCGGFGTDDVSSKSVNNQRQTPFAIRVRPKAF
jgi:hypothetical protein